MWCPKCKKRRGVALQLVKSQQAEGVCCECGIVLVKNKHGHRKKPKIKV